MNIYIISLLITSTLFLFVGIKCLCVYNNSKNSKNNNNYIEIV